jgi:hypothetical protein
MRLGYYADARRRPGEVFDLDPAKCKKDSDGNPILPHWVREDSEEARQEAAELELREQARMVAGARASAGKGAQFAAAGHPQYTRQIVPILAEVQSKGGKR